jgi:hypothetical protein
MLEIDAKRSGGNGQGAVPAKTTSACQSVEEHSGRQQCRVTYYGLTIFEPVIRHVKVRRPRPAGTIALSLAGERRENI